MAAIHLRQDKERPLTIQEVDSNFDLLNREVAQKLDTAEFNADNVLALLDGHSGSGSGLDADLLHGLLPNSTAQGNTVVTRDPVGNVYANQFYGVHVGAVLGNLTGNVTGTVTGNASNVDGIVQVEHGGTGSANPAGARTNLGLGTMSVQNKNTVDITGGTIVGIDDLEVADGGTGASTPSAARTNLGLVIGADVQAYAAILSGISNTSGNGFVIRTSTNSSVIRNFVPGNSIEITNSDGTGGNPTFALSLNPSVTSIIKTGTNGSGDVGSSGNRFNMLWGTAAQVQGTITIGSYLTGSNYNGSGNSTIAVNATPNNNGSTVMARDANGDVWARYFNGTATGVSGTLTRGSWLSGSNFTGGNNTTWDVQATVANNGNQIVARDASGNIYVSVVNGKATSAQYADLAEKYTTDKKYEPGTVIVVSEGGDSEATQSFKHDQRVIGVVSTNPAHLMNDGSTGQAIGLTGRLPVKVVGPIRKGQPIVSAPDGKATVGDSMYTFGQALETNLDPGVKLVECIIK